MKDGLTMVGISAALRDVQEDLRHAARSDAEVLITGEPGVGKDLAARSLHQQGSRRSTPLLTLHCPRLSDAVLESELLTHPDHTVFLDDVGELSLHAQATLLRCMETATVRVIAATHRDLLDAVARNAFYEQLFYRLNTIHIHVPPLRERREDIAVLLRHFLDEAGRRGAAAPDVSLEALGMLTRYDWPGNVRELRSVAGQLARQVGRRIEVTDLPEAIRQAAGAARRRDSAELRVVPHRLVVERLLSGASFWTEVYEPFMARDITRDDLRQIVRLGLDHAHGDYRQLVSSFHLGDGQYDRFIKFLRKYHCYVSYPRRRMLQARPLSHKVAASA